MKFHLLNYYKPTPKIMRQIGDTLLAVSLFAGSSILALNNHKLSLLFFWSGVIGKFLTNFYADEGNKTNV